MGTSLLSIRGLTKSYASGFLGLQRTPVLAGIDLELDAGQVKVVAGPNGSGKSTLLRILAGVESADGGSALVRGEAIAASSNRKRIGYLPDGLPFPPELPALRALELFGSLLGMPRSTRRPLATELLQRVGLGDAMKRPIGQYSKGMQRRFALAQAVFHEPELLLLDEPTDGLDAEGFGVYDELLRDARARGAGVLIATHVADVPCDKVSLLWRGKIERSGGPELLGSLLDIYRELGPESK
jgi:ABC-2 type transport system ATP-binding protein